MIFRSFKNIFNKLLRPFKRPSFRWLDSNGWSFDVVVVGDDLHIPFATCTAFGGSNDKMDNGKTASGVSTAAHPDLKGCALPMNFGPCAGSPIPQMPWRTMVQITECVTGKTLNVPLIDLGPAKWTGNAIDLTVAAARHFNPRATANNFIASVHVTIPGGARYLQ